MHWPNKFLEWTVSSLESTVPGHRPWSSIHTLSTASQSLLSHSRSAVKYTGLMFVDSWVEIYGSYCYDVFRCLSVIHQDDQVSGFSSSFSESVSQLWPIEHTRFLTLILHKVSSDPSRPWRDLQWSRFIANYLLLNRPICQWNQNIQCGLWQSNDCCIRIARMERVCTACHLQR